MSAADAYILVMPDGTDDGFLWAGEKRRTLDDAQRLFARPRRWPTLEREGWRVDPVSTDEFRARAEAAIRDHSIEVAR